MVLPLDGRVLMIRLSAMGDVLFSLETLTSLAEERPDVTIDFLVEDRFASILKGHPGIDRLIEVPRKTLWKIPAYVRALRLVRYDAVLDLHGILKSCVHVLLARSPHKIGYARPGSREGASVAYHHKVTLPTPLPHRADRGLLLLRALGLQGRGAPDLLPVGPDIPDLFAGSARPRVILHPGTSNFAAFKRWPIEKFVALARRLRSLHMSVAMSYGPGEEGLFRAAKAAVPELIEVDGPRLGLLGLGQAMRQADVVVAADTGPLHIAAGVGTRVVALFGPKDSRFYGPRGGGHRVLYHEVPCRPCKRRVCASPQCVLGIEVPEVERAITELTQP